MSDELNVHGNISKKSGFVSNLTESDRKYIVSNIEKIVFETNLIDALNDSGIYEGREFWNAIIAKLKEKVDKVDGKGLSTNDYTTEDKQKLLELAKRILDIDKALLTKVSEDSLNANLGLKVDKLQYNADMTKLKNTVVNHEELSKTLSGESEKFPGFSVVKFGKSLTDYKTNNYSIILANSEHYGDIVSMETLLAVLKEYSPSATIIVDKEALPGSNNPISSDYVYGLKQTYDMQFATFFNDMNEVEAIAKGRATGYVFDTVDDLDAWLSDSANTAKLNLGDNFYIRALDVPDYWWDGTSKQQLETQKVNLSEITDELNTKQNKTTIYRTSPDTTIGLSNNTEYRADGMATDFGIALAPDDNDVYPEEYESCVIFATGDNPQINIFAATELDYLIKFVGDDCNANYEFTPSSNTSYEISFKYIGNTIIEYNAGIPVYKHVFVARVGAF